MKWSWKKALIKLGFKNPETKFSKPGSHPLHEPMEPVMTPEEAVKTIPKEMLGRLHENDNHIGKMNLSGIRKLDEPKQIEMMELIARFSTVTEIMKYFREVHNIEIGISTVYFYRGSKRWKPILNKLREKYLNDPSEVGMFHKKVRLARREKIYHDSINKEDTKTALSAVNSSTEEMSENKGALSLTLNQFNMLSDDEISIRKKEIEEKIARMKPIVIEQKGESNGTGRV